MNERIRELADQVMKNAKGGLNFEQFYEKFAELIVRECAQFVEDKFDFCGDEIIIAEQILKQFGVEEPKGWVCPKCNTDRTKAACPQGPSAAVDGSCPMFGVAQ